MSPATVLMTVLLIGHSLFGQKTPQMLEQLLQTQIAGAQVSAQIINGAPLRYNWENGDTAEGVNARTVLSEGGTDAVILTEAQPLPDHVKWSETNAYVLKYYRLATQSNPKASVYLQETWPQGAGSAAWRIVLSEQLVIWQDIVAHVNANRDANTRPMRLIPAGQAMAYLQDAIASGKAPGLDAITALFDDDIHLNDLGHYYVTLVQYAILTGKTPVGLPHQLSDKWGNPFTAPNARMALSLQQIAWDAVLASGAVDASAGSNPVAASPGSGPEAIGVGLAAVNDWSTQQPFLNVMKTARPWILHKPGQWGGGDHNALHNGGYLDAHGWPQRLPRDLGTVGTVILTDMPAEALTLTGRYRLGFDGTGIVEVSGRAKNIHYGQNEVLFDFTPGPGPVEIRLQRSDPADYVRNITVVKERHRARFEQGQIFNPDWLERLNGFETLRFMDWMATNNARLSRWDDRPKPDDYTYTINGVPLDVMIALANQAEIDPWFTLPHLADDDFLRRFAEMTQVGLGSQRRVFVEFSNEVWNWQFEQARWAGETAQARWGEANAGAQYHGMRAAQVAQIWTEVFANAASGPQLVNVIATQTGWLGLEDSILNAPLWLAEPGFAQKPPWQFFDAYAVTGYFGGILGGQDRAPMVRRWIADSRAAARKFGTDMGLTGSALDDHVLSHGYDLAAQWAGQEIQDGALSKNKADTLTDLLERVLPYHARIAAEHGLDLVAYEGGSHVTGLGPLVDDPDLTAFYTYLNYSPQMGALYVQLLSGWTELGGHLFTAYSDVQVPSKWGSWGGLRHLSDENPRWSALKNAARSGSTHD